MKSVADWLREGDPVAADQHLSDAEARRMRQLLLARPVRNDHAGGVLWLGVAVLASIVLVAFGLGSRLADGPVSEGPGRLAQINTRSVPEPPPARQVQFVTPRGTRVVWVLQVDSPAQEGTR